MDVCFPIALKAGTELFISFTIPIFPINDGLLIIYKFSRKKHKIVSPAYHQLSFQHPLGNIIFAVNFQTQAMRQLQNVTRLSLQSCWTARAATSMKYPFSMKSATSWRYSLDSSFHWSSSCPRLLSTSWNGWARTTLATEASRSWYE